ncbi:MAG: SDR family oxidoreductase [Pseudomonadota bacterium]
MDILVSGASGQLGGRIAAALLADPSRPAVRAGVRNPVNIMSLVEAGATPTHFDYDDEDVMTAAMEGADAVVLIPTYANNALRVIQIQYAINAAKSAGVGHLIWCGLMASNRNSHFHVAPCLAYAEAAVRTSGLPWTILRNSVYLEPFLEWIPDLLDEQVIPYPAGYGRVSYVLRDDLARATAAVALDPGRAGEAHDLTGPEALTYAEIADMITRVTGRQVRYAPATDPEFVAMCSDPELPDHLPLTLMSMYHAVAAREFEPASDAIERLTGQAATGFEAALRQFWEARQ